jgi:hypothetical protein
MCMETTPYTYLLKFIPENKFYYGVRFAKGCSPDDFWKKYFTSCKEIHALMKERGVGRYLWDFEIRRVFENTNDARIWENKVLRRMKVIERDDFFNKTDNFAITAMPGEKNPFYGKTHSAETRQKISQKSKGRKFSDGANKKKGRKGALHPNYRKSCPSQTRQAVAKANRGRIHTEETRKKLSKAKRGEKHPLYGKKHSEQSRRQMSKTQQANFLSGKTIAWAKGKKFTEKHLKNMSESRKGKKVSEEQKRKISQSLKGRVPWNKGKSPTVETREKMRTSAQRRVPAGEKTRERIRKSKLGNKYAQGTIWINNGVEQKKIRQPELEQHLDDGWVRGRGWRNRRP